MQRAILGVCVLYLWVAGVYELAREGVFGGEARLHCWSADEPPAETFLQRVALEDCHADLGAMSYLRRDDRVIGVLIPLRSSANDADPISVLVQVLDPALVERIVDDETPLHTALGPELNGPIFRGQLLARDEVSEGRRSRLFERYDDLDGAFRILSLDARPAWTDGAVMLVFAAFGILGWRRIGMTTRRA